MRQKAICIGLANEGEAVAQLDTLLANGGRVASTHTLGGGSVLFIVEWKHERGGCDLAGCGMLGSVEIHGDEKMAFIFCAEHRDKFIELARVLK